MLHGNCKDDLGTTFKEAEQVVTTDTTTALLPTTSHVGIPESQHELAAPNEDGLACCDEMEAGRTGDLTSTDPASEVNRSDGSDLSGVESGLAEVAGTASLDVTHGSLKCPQGTADEEHGMCSAPLGGRTALPERNPETNESASKPSDESYSAVSEGCNTGEVEMERDDIRADKNSETDEKGAILPASSALDNNSDEQATAEGRDQVTLVAQRGGSCCQDNESSSKEIIEDSHRYTADYQVGIDVQASVTMSQEPGGDTESKPVLAMTQQTEDVCEMSDRIETNSIATSAPSSVQSHSTDKVNDVELDTLLVQSIEPEIEDTTHGSVNSITRTGTGPMDGVCEGANAYEDPERIASEEVNESIDCCSTAEAPQEEPEDVETGSTKATSVVDADQTEEHHSGHDEATVVISQLEEVEDIGEDPSVAVSILSELKSGPLEDSHKCVESLHESSAAASGPRDSASHTSGDTDDSEQQQKPTFGTSGSLIAKSNPVETAGNTQDMEPCMRPGVSSDDAADNDNPLQEKTVAVSSSREGNSNPLGDAGIINEGQQEQSVATSDSHKDNSIPLEEIGDQDEPLLVLQNVTSISRAVIPEEQLQHKPSAVDRWGWSTKISKVKSSALGTLKADDEPGTVAIPPPKVKSSTTTSVATSGSKKAAASAALPTTAPTTKPPAAPARVSKELTDIERARLFAASVLAETEKRERPNSTADSANNKAAGNSWWRQKMEALQAEL